AAPDDHLFAGPDRRGFPARAARRIGRGHRGPGVHPRAHARGAGRARGRVRPTVVIAGLHAARAGGFAPPAASGSDERESARAGVATRAGHRSTGGAIAIMAAARSADGGATVNAAVAFAATVLPALR